MQSTQFIWLNGNYMSWQKANVHLLTYTLHYGSGVFEGLNLPQKIDIVSPKSF